MKNILVTGAAGFIGANFVHYLLNQHPAILVISLDKLTYAGNLANLENLPDATRHIFVQGDINDFQLIKGLLQQYEIDTIVHFAAESHVDRSIQGPAAFIRTNMVGTFELLSAAQKYWLQERKWDMAQCRFHHISTDEVYGSLNKKDSPFTETSPYAPNSPYSASKAGSDHLVRAWHHTYGLPVTISNCSNNYGPFQHVEKLIPTVIRSCLQGQLIPVYGDGSNIRDWLYVEDHCTAIDRILQYGKVGEVYNIGGNAEKTNLDLVKTICRLLDEVKPAKQSYENLINFVQDRPGHDWRYAIDNSKISRELNWQPKWTLEQGLQKTIAYYLQFA